MANQPNIIVIDKQRKKAIVLHLAIPSDGSIKKKGHEKFEKYRGLGEELKKCGWHRGRRGYRNTWQQTPEMTSRPVVEGLSLTDSQ